ncbi:MAG: OpgC family protein [Cypionkella sp.]
MLKPLHVRDLRIDLLRGIALVMIFINHIPGTVWENYTSRNFGFSDAAEGFVLMSGMATGLAYGPVFMTGRPSWAQVLRPWRRAVTLWWVHLLVLACILVLFAVTMDRPEIISMASKRNILPALENLPKLLLPLAGLSHQFAYADILPLYIILLLAAPAILALAVRWPRALMLGSLAVWFVVGFWKIRMPSWPSPYGWFFNPLAWQVLFVAGILTGVAVRKGQRWLPIRRWPLVAAVVFVIGAAVWVQVPAVAAAGGHGLWLLHEYAGFPDVFTSFDKSFLFLPRLLHILALGYVLSAIPALRKVAASPKLAPIVLLGQNSLPVFATSSVLAYVAQVIKAMTPPSAMLDACLIVTGLGVLFIVSGWRDGQKRQQVFGRVKPV